MLASCAAKSREERVGIALENLSKAMCLHEKFPGDSFLSGAVDAARAALSDALEARAPPPPPPPPLQVQVPEGRRDAKDDEGEERTSSLEGIYRDLADEHGAMEREAQSGSVGAAASSGAFSDIKSDSSEEEDGANDGGSDGDESMFGED